MNKREFITHGDPGKMHNVDSTAWWNDNIEIFFNELDAIVNVDLKHITQSNPKKAPMGEDRHLRLHPGRQGAHLVSGLCSGF